MLVLFVVSIFVLTGITAIVVDISWYWANSLRIQRAADAAALAGVVWLPGSPSTGYSIARSEATKNGYVDGSGGVTVTPIQDSVAKPGGNPRQMDVTVSAPVNTFFMRIFGINTIATTRSSKAVFVLPVPMGSPENFYGVYCLTTPGNTSCPNNTAVTGASGTTVYSHGGWGAMQATGTDHGQGDAFTPLDDRTRSLGSNGAGGSNPDFDPNGYNYAVELPAGGNIYIFDPTACAVGDQLGTGDHWNDGGGWEAGPKVYSVSTYFNLYDMTIFPLDYSRQPFVAGSGTMFQREYQYDKSGTYGTPSYVANLKPSSSDGVPLADCAAGKIPSAAVGGFWHDKWWPIATGLPAGTYRLNLRSAALGAVNQKATFENDWSIEATGGGNPRVYGLGKIVEYNIIQGAGQQAFYLAQIGPENAGKTLEIDLFDIGDIGGTGKFRIQSPDGDAYNYATFTYTTDANCGRTRGSSDACSNSSGTTVITSAAAGNSSFNDTWTTVLISLPSTYGCSVAAPCLKPPGETQQGWWKIEYQTSAGANDTTTWMVNLRGNPVHLVIP